MNLPHTLARLGLATALLGGALSTLAGDGHDHDHGDAAPSAPTSALPRFAAVSETFELVGVLDGRQLTLYLDRFADNAPVRGAQIELDLAGTKYMAAASKATPDDAVYGVTLKQAPPAGVLPITATVTAGAEVDLLAGELDLHDTAPGEASAHARSWTTMAGWAAAGLAVLVVLVLVLSARRRVANRPLRAGGAA